MRIRRSHETDIDIAIFKTEQKLNLKVQTNYRKSTWNRQFNSNSALNLNISLHTCFNTVRNVYIFSKQVYVVTMSIVFYWIILICLLFITELAFCDDIVPFDSSACWNKSCGVEFDPFTPLINCSYVWVVVRLYYCCFVVILYFNVLQWLWLRLVVNVDDQLLVLGTQPLTLIQRQTEITIAGTNPNPEP